jgi:hypothetical protein
MSRSNVLRCLMLIAVLFCSPAHAAVTTGSLRGVVRGPSGAVLRTAAVELYAPLLNRRWSSAPDDRGEYRFLAIPPGRYELTATADGFEGVRHVDVAVALGAEGTLDVTLTPSLSQEVTVVAAPVLVDTTTATASTTITAEQFTAFPSRRDFQQLTVLAPGVRFDFADPFSPTVSGATHLENDYIIEGLSTRDPLTGRSATNLTMNFVQEVQVMTGALPAEYGRATGGVINAVTKSGTNAFHGDLNVYYSDADWGEQAVTFQQLGFGATESGHDRNDAALAISGPVLRDRMWFFGAFDPRRDDTQYHLENPDFGIDRVERITEQERVYAAKFTAAPTASQTVTLTGFGNPVRASGWLGFVNADPSNALQVHYSGSRNLTLRHDWILGRGILVETAFGRHSQLFSYRSADEEMSQVPAQYDIARDFVHGGVAHAGSQRDRRTAVTLRVSHALPRHDVRYGADLERNRHSSDYIDRWIYFFGPSFIDESIGERDLLMDEYADYSGYGSNDATAFFAQDRLRVRDNLIVTLGLRWEQQLLGSAKGVTIATGSGANGTIEGVHADTFELDDNWAPRIAAVWDPSSRGRAKLFAAAGRTFEAIPVYLNVSALNGVGTANNYYYSDIAHTADDWYNPTGSPLNEDWVLFFSEDYRTPAPEPRPIDPTLKLQYQDEYSVGGQMQLGSAWMVGARLVRRDLKRVIEDIYVLDPSNPRARRGLIITNPGAGRYGEGYDPPSRRYEALELNAQKRLTRRWQLISSFVTARERGDYDGLYSYTANGAGFGNISPDFQLPRFQQNAYGRLHGDRPYAFKVHSSVELPGNVTLSQGFEYVAGRPISRMAHRSFTFANRNLFFTPRGSEGRTPDVWTLDLHAAWRLPAIRTVSASLIVDAFNSTNNHGVLTVDENHIVPSMPGAALWRAPSNLDEFGLPKYDPSLPRSAYYGTPTRFQPGRELQLGVKLSF